MSHPSSKLENTLSLVLLFLSIAFIGSYLFIAFSRINYPFELEWLEGGMLQIVAQVLEGKSIYAAPTIEYIPFIYGPVYYYLSALAVKIFGLNFHSLRLVSLFASALCFIFIYYLARSETKSKVPGIIAAGLFAATFTLSGSWLDLARVDTLGLALLLAGTVVVRRGSVPAIISGVTLFFIAFLTKQSLLLVPLALALYYLLFERGIKRYLFPVVLGILLVINFLILNAESYHWTKFYLFDLPSQHPLLKSEIVVFWLRDLITPLFIGLCLVPVAFSGIFSESRKRGFFYLFWFGAILLSCWASRMHLGGWDNVLMPLYAALSVMAGIGVSHIPALASRIARLVELETKADLVRKLILVLVIIQFITLAYNPSSQIPDAKDLAAGREFVRRLKQIDGEVYIPFHGYLSDMAGKEQFAHANAVKDVVHSTNLKVGGTMLTDISKALDDQIFKVVILDSIWAEYADVSDSYIKIGEYPWQSDEFTPVTGLPLRPIEIYTTAEYRDEALRIFNFEK